ncbi:MAG: cytochrome c-type biogenesis protein [Chloroflexota bacterium]|jgi:cytochrome c-type biogenesis protein CcmH
MTTKPGLLTFILTLLAALLLAGSAWAQTSTAEISDDEVNAIASKIYCPVCEGIPLDTCPTLACSDWRAEIRLQLAQGRSEAEIIDHFVRQYGDAVAAEPPRRGVNWLIWAAPFLILAFGGVLFSRYLRELKRPSVAATPTPPLTGKKKKQTPETAVDDDYIRRVEQEIGRE